MGVIQLIVKMMKKGAMAYLQKKIMSRNDQLDVVDLHTEKLKSCSKVKLSTGSGFQELYVPNFFSLSQIQVGMDEVQKKKGKRNVCYPTPRISPRKIRRFKPAKAKKSLKKLK
jgi:hypothetical protein